MAQENPDVHYGRRYIELNTKAFQKFTKRTDKHQQRWLRRLARRENRWLAKLKKNDSAVYARVISNPVRFDSIQKALEPDSLTLVKFGQRKHPGIDSLKKIKEFIAGKLSSANQPMPGTSDQFGNLQGNLNYQQHINGLVEQRSKELKSIASSASGKVNMPVGLNKDLFYGKAKLKAIKEMADEPSKAEEKALEYLQGTEGFDQAFASSSPGGMQTAASVEDLEKMGFQTKRSVNVHLQQKFGSNLSGVQQQMGDQVKKFQQQVSQLHAPVKDLSKQAKDAKRSVGETKQSLSQALKIDKPSFKVNHMRGLPLSKRLEKSYSWNTSRASSDGARPAVMELAATAGFKHTPRLTYGAGLSAAIGLGQDWNNIRFSMQGIGMRTFATWQWQYGVGGYAGYERMISSVGGLQLKPESQTNAIQNSKHGNESIMLGLTKSHKMTSKWNGAIQVLYDVWWKEKGLNSPIIIRFLTSK